MFDLYNISEHDRYIQKIFPGINQLADAGDEASIEIKRCSKIVWDQEAAGIRSLRSIRWYMGYYKFWIVYFSIG